MIKVRGFEVVRDDCRKFPHKEIILPVRKTKKAMACDLYSNENATILPGGTYQFMTDVKAYMPDDEGAIMNVRSSIGFAKQLMLVNTQGWIDADFYSNPDNDGNIGICLKNIGDKPQTIEEGERIAQIAFFKFGIPDGDDEVDKAERVSGTGSTGTK